MDPHYEEMKQNTESVKQIADAVSTQVRTVNRTWFVTIGVALLVLFPPLNAGTTSGVVALPFQLGSVDGFYFYPTVFALFSVLIVAFATAHAQTARAQKLALLALRKIQSSALLGIHAQDLFDMFRYASVNRVAPLAQLLRGKYQFQEMAASCPTWLRLITALYYFLLKLVAALVYWLLPAYAYWLAFKKAEESGLISNWIIISAGAIVTSSLLIVAFSDLQYVFETLLVLGKKSAPAPVAKE